MKTVAIKRVDGVVVEHTINGVDVMGTETMSVRRAAKIVRQAINPEPWPLLILPLKLLAKDGDRGAGDIIARTIGPIGGDAFKSWYKKIFGKPCGCGARVETLNARYPL